MKLTAAQTSFMKRFEEKQRIHVRNGEKSTAQNLIKRGLIKIVEVDKYALTWVEKSQ